MASETMSRKHRRLTAQPLNALLTVEQCEKMSSKGGFNPKVVFASMLALASCWLLAPDAGAAARRGMLEQSFGEGGKVQASVSAVPAESATFSGALFDAEEDLYLEFRSEMRQGELRRIERRHPDGRLDGSFGSDGRVSVSAGSGLALGPRGGLFVGVTNCRGGGPGLLLLGSSGRPDSRYGHRGCSVELDLVPREIAIEQGGRMVIAGERGVCPCRRGVPRTREAVIAMLRPNGRLNKEFGQGGYLGLRRFDGGASVTVKPSPMISTSAVGTFVAVGSQIIKLTSAGVLDHSFAEKGVFRGVGFAVDNDAQFHPIALLSSPTGAAMVASMRRGPMPGDNEEVVITKLLPDGSPDPSFGMEGEVPTGLGSNGLGRPTLVAAPGGTVLLQATSRNDSSPVLARLDSRGGFDSTFGTSGIVMLSSANGGNRAFDAMAVSSAGTVVTAGEEGGALAVSVSSSGSRNTAFAQAGELHVKKPKT